MGKILKFPGEPVPPKGGIPEIETMMENNFVTVFRIMGVEELQRIKAFIEKVIEEKKVGK